MKNLLRVACCALPLVAVADIDLAEGKLKAEAIGMVGIASDPSLSAVGAGLDGVYTRRYSDQISVGFGGTVAVPLYENDKDGAYAAPLLLDLESSQKGKGEGFYALNRLQLNISGETYGVTVGRFLVELPLASSHVGWRFAPNSFEGVLGKFSKVENVDFFGAYFHRFSGHDSRAVSKGSSKGSFSSISDSALAETFGSNSNVDDSGVVVAGANYKNSALGSGAKAWIYAMPDIKAAGNTEGSLYAYYVDASHDLENMGKSVSFGVQAIGFEAGKDLKGYTHNILGAKIDSAVSDEISLNFAFNTVSGKGAVLDLFGAKPAYTSGVESGIKGLQKGNAFKLGASYNPSDLAGLKNGKLGAWMLYQKGDQTLAGDKTKVTTIELLASADLMQNFTNELRININTQDDTTKLIIYRAGYKF